MTVEHTEIRDFIQRFNDSYDGFPYGFCTFRTVSAWFPGWFGELGAVWGSVFGGVPLSRSGADLPSAGTSMTQDPRCGPHSPCFCEGVTRHPPTVALRADFAQTPTSCHHLAP